MGCLTVKQHLSVEFLPSFINLLKRPEVYVGFTAKPAYHVRVAANILHHLTLGVAVIQI